MTNLITEYEVRRQTHYEIDPPLFAVGDDGRRHRFVRYADDCNTSVRSRRADERVLDSMERFLK